MSEDTLFELIIMIFGIAVLSAYLLLLYDIEREIRRNLARGQKEYSKVELYCVRLFILVFVAGICVSLLIGLHYLIS